MRSDKDYTSGISICIPTLNEEAMLPNTLDNIQERIDEMHEDWDIQVVIVDGESTDNTRDIAKDSDTVDKIVTVKEEGILWARDAGHIAADNTIVVHIDADTVYKEDWLNRLIAPFQDPDVAMTYGKVLGQGSEEGLRQVYQKGCRLITGEYAPGQNRAILQSAYSQSGGYKLNSDQTSAAMTSIEEETRFPNRVGEKVGEVVYVEDAVCVTSGRNLDSMFGDEEKTGGAQWQEVKANTR